MAAMLPMQWTLSFPVFLACIVAMGFTYRAVIPLLDSLVSRVLSDPCRQYGKLRVAGSVGFIAISLAAQLTGRLSGDTALPILAAFLVTETQRHEAVPPRLVPRHPRA